jgi:hypothetical protein
MKLTTSELNKAERQLREVRNLFDAAYATVNGKVPMPVLDRMLKVDRALASAQSAIEGLRYTAVLRQWR